MLQVAWPKIAMTFFHLCMLFVLNYAVVLAVYGVVLAVYGVGVAVYGVGVVVSKLCYS